jgi:hypothetical protein
MTTQAEDAIYGAVHLFCGLAVWALLVWAWRSGSDVAVLTIMPMMGTPYIVATGLVCSGVAQLLPGGEGIRRGQETP